MCKVFFGEDNLILLPCVADIIILRPNLVQINNIKILQACHGDIDSVSGEFLNNNSADLRILTPVDP